MMKDSRKSLLSLDVLQRHICLDPYLTSKKFINPFPYLDTHVFPSDDDRTSPLDPPPQTSEPYVTLHKYETIPDDVLAHELPSSTDFNIVSEEPTLEKYLV